MHSYSNFINSIRFNFLYVDKYSFGRDWIYPLSMIPYNMFRYIAEGQGNFCINGMDILVKKGQVIYIPEGCTLSCQALDDNFSFISIRFTTSVRYEGADFLTDYYGLPSITESSHEIRNYFNDVLNWAKTDSNSKIFRIRGYLELIIGSILDLNGKHILPLQDSPSEKEKYSIGYLRKRAQKSKMIADPRIQVILDQMITYPTRKYTTNRLCKIAELEETSMRKLFKKQTGQTPNEFLRNLRMTTAARKLLATGDQVSVIAYDVGYEDLNYFIRIFKKTFGLTPNQYRNTARE